MHYKVTKNILAHTLNKEIKERERDVFTMIQLASFQEITSADFDESILQKIIAEIYSVIKENAAIFRLQIEISAESLEEKLYKHNVALFFMGKGFKVVNFNGFMFIDWSAPSVYPTTNPAFIQANIDYIGTYFTAADLYLAVTGNVDLRKISYRPLMHRIKTEINRMNLAGQSEALLSLGVSTIMTAEQLNNLFAPDLMKINMTYSDVMFSFVDGGLFKITLNSVAEIYTEIPYEVLFGTRVY